MPSLPPSRFPFSNFPHLTPRQWFQLGGALLLLWIVIRFAYVLFLLLLLGAVIGLLLGLQEPQRFRFLFGDKATKSNVGWGFGSVICVLTIIVASLEPQATSSEPVASNPPTVNPPSVPAADSPALVQAQKRAKLAEERAALAEKRAAALAAQTKTKSESQPQRLVPAGSIKAPRSAKETSEPVIQAPPLSPKQLLEQLMAEQFGERLRQVDVQQEGRVWIVDVEFNRSERLGKEATINYLEGDMKAAYKAIFTSGLLIGWATMTAYGDGFDGYGNAVQFAAYRTRLDGEVGTHINWDNYEKARWVELWRVDYVHPDYRRR